MVVTKKSASKIVAAEDFLQEIGETVGSVAIVQSFRYATWAAMGQDTVYFTVGLFKVGVGLSILLIAEYLLGLSYQVFYSEAVILSFQYLVLLSEIQLVRVQDRVVHLWRPVNNSLKNLLGSLTDFVVINPLAIFAQNCYNQSTASFVFSHKLRVVYFRFLNSQ